MVATVVDIDLDALRKGNADGRRTKKFRLGGKVYEVAGKMPLYVVLLMDQDRTIEALRLWLGDEQAEELAKSGIDTDEFGLLLKDLYEVTPGEPEPSAG